MKKLLFIFVAAFTLGLTSCSKDDSSEPTQVVDNAKHTWILTITTETTIAGVTNTETTTEEVSNLTAAEVDLQIKEMNSTTTETVNGITFTIKVTVTKKIKA